MHRVFRKGILRAAIKASARISHIGFPVIAGDFASRSRSLIAPAIVFACIHAGVAVADLPSSRLNSIFPPGGQAGNTVEVAVAGADLDGATGMRFSHAGITAELKSDAKNATDQKFSVVIGADVPPGNYEAYVVGRHGLSNPRVFVVGSLKELAPKKDPSTAPVPIEVGATVSGRSPGTAVHQYLLKMSKGERVILDCATHDIDSKMLAVMTVVSDDGRELARSRRGGLIDFSAPEKGEYTIVVHDLIYRSGPEYFYRLTAENGPHIDAIFPPAGQPGTKSKFTIYGRKLPNGKKSTFRGVDGKLLEQMDVEIELPSDPAHPIDSDAAVLLGSLGAGVDAMSWRLKTDAGTSNPVLIGFAKAPLLLEDEAADTGGKSQKINPPCEVVGRFFPHGDHDSYTFSTTGPAVYWIEVLSERLGLPTSPELLVQRVGKSPKGQSQVTDVQDVGGPDMAPMGKKGAGASAAFTGASRDIEYRFEAGKEPGDYRATLNDLFNESVDNPALIYRMSIHEPAPDFRLVMTTPAPKADAKAKAKTATAEPGLAMPLLRRGGTAAININVFRRDGFDGAITVEATDLPTGVHADPVVIAPEDSVGTLIIWADDDAPGTTIAMHIVGKATIDGKDVAHPARAGAVIWPTVTTNNVTEKGLARLTGELPLAVSAEETAELAITTEKRSIEAKPTEKLKIPVKADRRNDAGKEIKLALAGLPAKVANKVELSIPAGKNEASLDLDLSALKLPAGTYTLYLEGKDTVKYVKKPASEKSKKPETADVEATYCSLPITLKILPK